MEVWHKNEVLQTLAAERLSQFVRQRRRQWQTEGLVSDLETYERQLHEHMMALERELIAEELARYDIDVKEIEVEGVVYRQTLTSSATYLSAAGPVRVERHLYRPAGRGSKSICPLELRAGVVGGLFTPRAARQAAFTMAHLTSREAEKLFVELGGMTPSHNTLDRLPKELSSHWEAQRATWEEALLAAETVPNEAVMLAVSLDGVMVPMKDAGRAEKRSQPDKEAKGPAGYREVGCGSVALYNEEGERLSTVRYGRMPEYKKAALCGQLEAECQSILTLRPHLKVVKLADGAEENWRFLSHLDLGLPPRLAGRVQPEEIVDFCHAADHLKKACDAIWLDDHVKSKAEFQRLRTLLKEAEDGAQKVVRSLKYRFSRARGRRRGRIEKQLTYFRNQQHRMQYARYLREGLPIASGVIEATCKTLATQRMKQSGMSWQRPGGQAILTLRSLIQSNRWERAWALLSADFRKEVNVINGQHECSQLMRRRTPSPIMTKHGEHKIDDYYSLPLVM